MKLRAVFALSLVVAGLFLPGCYSNYGRGYRGYYQGYGYHHAYGYR